jgi:hypothetical protein
MYTEKTETTLVTAELDSEHSYFSVKIDHMDIESTFCVSFPDGHWLSKDELMEMRRVINKALREFKG